MTHKNRPYTQPKNPVYSRIKTHLSNMGISLRKTPHGEFRVNYKHGREATAYYTDDLQDAYNTALAMLRGQYKK